MIKAATSHEVDPSLVLAVAVRRAPKIVASDEPTRKLVGAFIKQVLKFESSELETGLALVVAGVQDHAQQLSQLAALAAAQASAVNFFSLVNTPGSYRREIRGRLKEWEKLVGLALEDLGVHIRSTELVQNRAWQVLARLTVLMPRLEPPDETDWGELANKLAGIARNGDLESALNLRNRLVTLAEDYPPRAATVDTSLLRRAVHQHLDSAKGRHRGDGRRSGTYKHAPWNRFETTSAWLTAGQHKWIAVVLSRICNGQSGNAMRLLCTGIQASARAHLPFIQ